MSDPTAPGANPAAGQTPYPAPAQAGAPGASTPLPTPPTEGAGAVPAPPYGAPPPAAAPPQKKGKALKIVLIILAAVVVLCGLGIFAVVKLVSSALDFSVGNCVNVSPVSEVAVPVDPVAVSCDSADAGSKIVAVHEGATLAEADTLCADAPGYIGALEITIGSNTKLLCLADN